MHTLNYLKNKEVFKKHNGWIHYNSLDTKWLILYLQCHSVTSLSMVKWMPLTLLSRSGKKWKSQDAEPGKNGEFRIGFNFRLIVESVKGCMQTSSQFAMCQWHKQNLQLSRFSNNHEITYWTLLRIISRIKVFCD